MDSHPRRRLTEPWLTVRVWRFKLTCSWWDVLWLGGAFAFLVGCLVYVARPLALHELFMGRTAQTELMMLWDGLDLGQPKEEVRRLIGARSPVLLIPFMPSRNQAHKRTCQEAEEVWEIRTRYQLSAQNWWMYLEFDVDGNLVWAGIRLGDATTVRPPSAPPDKVGETLTSPPGDPPTGGENQELRRASPGSVS